jgi:hypothetical protein
LIGLRGLIEHYLIEDCLIEYASAVTVLAIHSVAGLAVAAR